MKTILKSPLEYKKNKLTFDGQSIEALCKKRSTPFYLYSTKTMAHHFLAFKKYALKAGLKNPLICYAVKANTNHDILAHLNKLGAGADVVSIGEFKKAIKAGISPFKIVFSGVGKTAKEITEALKSHPQGIYSFNVESIEELAMINQIAKKLNKKARVAFRLNPEVNVVTHKHISTGNKTHKFGLLRTDICESLLNPALWSHLQLVGLSIHIGSQLTDMKATIEAILELSNLALELEKEHQIKCEFLDVGGGLGIDYTDEDKKNLTQIDDYMNIVFKSLTKFYFLKTKNRPRIVFEPGRILVGKMGVLVSRVIRTKISDGRHFTIIDAGMNDLIRPALYEAHHEIYPELFSPKTIKSDVVGPICETADCFGEKRKMPANISANDIVVIDNAGAYGRSMASTYNERPLPKEIIL